MVVARSQDRMNGDVGQKVRSLRYKINVSWNVMHTGVTIAHNSVVTLKFVKRVDVQCSHHAPHPPS